jgi:hypothetical protein
MCVLVDRAREFAGRAASLPSNGGLRIRLQIRLAQITIN